MEKKKNLPWLNSVLTSLGTLLNINFWGISKLMKNCPNIIQSNFFNTETRRTELSVRIMEVEMNFGLLCTSALYFQVEGCFHLEKAKAILLWLLASHFCNGSGVMLWTYSRVKPFRHSALIVDQDHREKCLPTILATGLSGHWYLSVTSLRPIAYVWGSQFSRKLNFLYIFFARWPWHPSPNKVTLAWSSIPRSNMGCQTTNGAVRIWRSTWKKSPK